MSLRWPLVALEVGAGAHCARTGTVGRARPRGGPVCGAPSPRSRTPETRVVSDGGGRCLWLVSAKVARQENWGCASIPEKTVDDELPVKQMIEVRKGPVEQFFEMIDPQMVVPLVDAPKIVVGLAVSSGGDGSSGPGRIDTTDVADAAVEVPVGEAWPPGISKCSTATESKVEGSSGKAGSSWPGADDMTRHVDATVAKAIGEARPPEFAKDSATTESKVTVSSGEVGFARPGAKSTPNAFDAAVAMLADDARPPGIAKKSVTTESDIAVSSDKARPPGIEKKSATTDSDGAASFGEPGPSWPRANDVDSCAVTAAVKSAGKDRHPGNAKNGATKESELAV